MARTQHPTQEQLRVFFAKLSAWRASLTEIEQRLTDSMLAAALGLTDESYEEWCAESPESDSGGGAMVSRWLSTPWGMTYTLRSC